MKVLVVYIFLLINFLLINQLAGQSFYIKPMFGSSYYQGDLAPKPFNFSFGPGNMAYGVSVGKPINNYVTIYGRYLHGRISADDRFADGTRKNRNLNFVSNIDEVSLSMEFEINRIWKSLNKYNLRLFMNAGVGVTFFDPKTLFEGEYIHLQPLGTEGQFLPSSSLKPYSLNTLVLPIGGNLEFPLNRRVHFGLEARSVKTSTDYLDDVSGTYPDYYEMYESGNIAGALLTNRSGELLGSTQPVNRAGEIRGNKDNKDWYAQIGLYLKIAIGKLR